MDKGVSMQEFKYSVIKNDGDIRKLVIFLQGYNSSVEDISPYADALLEQLQSAAIVIPVPPIVSERNPLKRHWFALSDIDPDRRRRLPATSTPEIVEIYNRAGRRISEAARRMNIFITQMQEKYRVTDENTFVIGFSQGAMLAIYTALTRPKPLGGVMPVAGIICGKDTLEKELVSRPTIYLFHGEKDISVQYKTLAFTKQWLDEHDIYWEAFEYKDLEHRLTFDEMTEAAQIINDVD